MKITFVLPYAGLAGGIRVIAIYADRLQRRGHDVAVVSTPPRHFPLRRRVKWFIQGKGWQRTPVLEPGHFEGLDVRHRVLESYRPVIDTDVPDAEVVLATHWTTAGWVARLSPAKGSKAIFIQGYETVPGKVLLPLDEAWRMPFHKIVISEWLVKLSAERFGDTCVSHVPNSVDMGQFNAPPRGKQARPTVGLLYSTSPFKACEVSLRAFSLAAKSLAGMQLVSFGAERPARKLPLPADAEFHYRPPQSTIKDLYAKCDVWLCGSRREGFHLPPLEAMACRCPVVSTRVGGPVDIIREGINGHLVDVEDSTALANRTASVLSLPEDQWRVMSDAAYSTATRYTWEDATSLLEDALAVAIERDRRGELGGCVSRNMGVFA